MGLVLHLSASSHGPPTPTDSETAHSLHLQLRLQALPSKEDLTEPLNRQLRCSPTCGGEHFSESWSGSLCPLNARGGAPARRRQGRRSLCWSQHGAGRPGVSHLTRLLNFFTYKLMAIFENYILPSAATIYVAGDNTGTQSLTKEALSRNLLPHLPHVTNGGKPSA